MITKMSFACLVMILYMGLFYFKSMRLPLKSTRMFRYIYFSALLNAVFDGITIYTVNHLDTVPAQLNYVVHIIFLMTILCFIFFLFLYLRSYLEQKIRFPNYLRVLQSVPFILSTICIIILPITYEQGELTNYSYGPKAYALYFSVVIYLALILFYCIRYWIYLNRERREALIASVPIFIITASIQMIIPEILLTLLGLTVIMIGLMLSNENVEKYIDKPTEMFNQYALETVLKEYESTNTNYYVGVMMFNEMDECSERLIWEQYHIFLSYVCVYMKKQYKKNSYRLGKNGCVFLSTSQEEAQKIIHGMKAYVQINYGDDYISLSDTVLPLCKNSKEMMSQILSNSMEMINSMTYYDFLTDTRNRNAFEKDKTKLLEKGEERFYLVIELNQLKVINDTFGHARGDELLHTTSGLLKEVTGKEGTVYRIGGDEFGILWKGTEIETFLEQLEQKRTARNQTRNIPIEYAIGYSKLNKSEAEIKADRMMYQSKNTMKTEKTVVEE